MDLTQGYFLLRSLKDNLPDGFHVEKKWVDDFHSVLKAVETETGTNLSAFRVPQDDVYKPALSREPSTGMTRYGKPSIERSRLLLKLDAVLGYFQFTEKSDDTPKQRIGFKK